MSLNIPRQLAKERVLETYKRTRRIATSAREAGVTEPTARRWLFNAGLIGSADDRSSLGEAHRNTVSGPPVENLVRVDREPCGKCGTRRDVGCKHYPKQPEAQRPMTDRERAEAMWSNKS